MTTESQADPVLKPSSPVTFAQTESESSVFQVETESQKSVSAAAPMVQVRIYTREAPRIPIQREARSVESALSPPPKRTTRLSSQFPDPAVPTIAASARQTSAAIAVLSFIVPPYFARMCPTCMPVVWYRYLPSSTSAFITLSAKL